ncbi:hypothetical protein EDB81DRAFT_889524 [Dactylonectria macrodidyma]|uniref:Uncharacterized protein n=1 Tax=Dactylonectria macrodidyma TaxID=307937 RepID=A0A9P9DUT5_9HYPO|nr:hypothetical protein EDB81DRAFT_889524 [Dactylonectria macrodidyma]
MAMAMGALFLVNKIHNIPDLDTVHDALQMVRTKSKIAAESTMQALNDIKAELLKQAANTGRQALEGIREGHGTQNETKKGKKNNPALGRTYSDDLLRFITQIYAVLMTREIRGTYVYACDSGLQEYLKGLIPFHS